jgi:DNA-binding NarL/FixJ family response regulator
MEKLRIKILLADNHRIVRQGLRHLLEEEPDLEVIGEAEDGRGAIDLALKLPPDLIIMDIGMPGISGIEATQVIRAMCPEIRVIALSMQSEKWFVRKMLAAGASGYMLKDCACEDLITAIRQVMAGKTFFSAEISHLIP